jgi:hypothetical protein
MPWILPLIAALFWFDSYRPSTGTSPLYGLRTFLNMGEGHTILDFGPFVAGVAAWIGSRDGRRGLADLVSATARPRWAAQLATWAATAIWAVAAYLVFVGVMFAWYARQGVGGTPSWWWVAPSARHDGGRVQRRRVRRRGLVAEPVRRAGGRVRRVPGHVPVVPHRVQPHQRVGADPTDQLPRQLRGQRPGRRRDLRQAYQGAVTVDAPLAPLDLG